MSQATTTPQPGDAGQATHEVIAGQPGRAGRLWLGRLSLVAFALFIIDTFFVVSGALHNAVDTPIERAVQGINWGPFADLMTFTNQTSGAPQVLAGVVAVVALLIYERRAGYLMALGAVGSALDAFLKVSIQRRRPTANIVQILDPSNGYSYPSGHAVFFTWFAFMLAVSLAPRLGRRSRAVLWCAAGALIFFACLGRVWAGAHWPTDVFGGFFLGVAWSAFVLWLPERWLPSPSWGWVGRRRSRVRADAS